MTDDHTTEPATLASPLTLPCGAVLANRICNAAMTEGLADPMNRAMERHVALYGRWAEGGAGLNLTGNVQVDRRYMERPGNVAIDGNGGHQELAAYAAAGSAHGTHLWMQIGHAGRQTPRRVNPEPVAPSAVPLALPEAAFGHPRVLEAAEIEDVIRRFAHVAAAARETGFTGVQIHSAHGYLLSEFLSPLVNRRTDRWGGDLENRAQLLLGVVGAVRDAVGPDYPISVKLNSSDFQKGGFSHADCIQVVSWLGEAGIDLLEISGGNYEQPRMMGVDGREPVYADLGAVRESTRRREAYFLAYAERIRAVARMPLMVTGGFRSRDVMSETLADGECDVIGLGRPLCVDTALAGDLIAGRVEVAQSYEHWIDPAKAALSWFCLQLLRMGDGHDPDPEISGRAAIAAFLDNEERTAARLARPQLVRP